MKSGDIFILGLALALLPGLYLGLWGKQNSGTGAILVSGEEQLFAPLDRNVRYRIQGNLGESLIQVENGKIRFIDSPCAGKQCIHSGWLDQEGDFAACLPNGISIAVRGADPRYDSINF